MPAQDYIFDQLQYIDPGDYNDWITVGMALKHEGYSCDVWDDWSRRSDKYKPGQCEEKWNSFNEENAGPPATGGTIWHLAEQGGWPAPKHNDGELTWGSMIRSMPDKIIDPSFARESLPQPDSEYNPLQDAIRYVSELFSPDECVGFCVKSQASANGKKRVPASDGQIYSMTASKLIEFLKPDINKFTDPGGAWIRFNPLDGQGCGNSNVTRFTYALVESDDDEIEKQYAIYQQLNLPIKVLVHSGNKSLHAIVKVDAKDANEYRERVRTLYKVCSENGLSVDEQDKNASRYSRFPGFMRGDVRQRSVAWDIGAASWDEWQSWLENEKDTLPDSVTLSDVIDNLPPLKPEMIHGLLRRGHKMLVSAPSKAGKSFLLMELAVCVAEGMSWIGFKVEQGKVLYINLELDGASCLHRFADIYERLKLTNTSMSNITVLNLRGHATTLGALAPILVKRFKDEGYSCMILDPIYKINDGDENNAGDMTRLCNQFDAIARECGCSMVYSHHFSKGASAKYASSMDRSSGSGVFARDPDCIVAMSELQVSEDHAKMYREAYNLPPDKKVSGWEMSFTVREFPSPDDMRVWFDWPIHMVDENGWLNDAAKEGTNGHGVGKGQVSKKDRRNEIAAAFAALKTDDDNAIRVEEIMGHLKMSSESEWKETDLNNAMSGSAYKSYGLKIGKITQRVIAPRNADLITFDGEDYINSKPGSGRANWVRA